MDAFDVSRTWIVLTPRKPDAATAETEAAEDLRRCLGLLRARAGLTGSPELRDGSTDDGEGKALILLNSEDREGNDDYAWRAAAERVEIYGASRRALAVGIYDFLDALGFRWPAPGSEILPPESPSGTTAYPLGRNGALKSTKTAAGSAGRRRLVLGAAMGGKDGESWVRWAFRNRLDAVVIPFDADDSTIDALSERVHHRRQRIAAAARRYALSIEEGGRCLSRLVPRRLFLRNRELFRMREGKRTADFNFCPTNPDTIAVLTEQAKRRFRDRPDIEVFHCWPDEAEDGGWCSCPSCRAFSPAEQTLIAVNAVADALAEIRSGAKLSYIPDDDVSEAIRPRGNLIPVDEPRKGSGAAGWIFADRRQFAILEA